MNDGVRLRQGCLMYQQLGTAEFSAHIRELAEAIATTLAGKAAEFIRNRATSIQHEAEAEPDLADEAGLFLALSPTSQAEVTSYREKFGIDLLTFTDSDAAALRGRLEDDYLPSIVEAFARGGELPFPKLADPLVAALDEIAGEGGPEAIPLPEEPPTGVDPSHGRSGGILGDYNYNSIFTIHANTVNWHAATAFAFREEFLPKIPWAVDHQTVALRTVRNQLAANQALVMAARCDVDQIAHAGLTAVEAFDECGIEIDASAMAGVVGGVFALLAGALTAELGIGFLGMLAGATAIVQNWDNAVQVKEVPLGAATPDGILQNIRLALHTCYADLDRGYWNLATAIDETCDYLVDNPDDRMRAPRPDAFCESTQDNIIANTE